MADVLYLKDGGHLVMIDDVDANDRTFTEAVRAYMGDQAAQWIRGFSAEQDALRAEAVEIAVDAAEERADEAERETAEVEDRLLRAQRDFKATLSALLDLANGMKFYKSLPNGARERLYKIMNLINENL